jgi:hypothetical protein
VGSASFTAWQASLQVGKACTRASFFLRPVAPMEPSF